MDGPRSCLSMSSRAHRAGDAKTCAVKASRNLVQRGVEPRGEATGAAASTAFANSLRDRFVTSDEPPYAEKTSGRKRLFFPAKSLL